MARAPRRKQKMDNTTKILLVAFAVVGLLLAYFGGKFIFQMVSNTPGNVLPGVPVNTNPQPVNGSDVAPTNPLQSSSGPAAHSWDGKSRVNILLLGLDYTEARAVNEPGPRFSDTMILVTIDPLSRTIGALSIRRDLWVNVPGYDYNKINKAYFIGEAYKLPGGGPQLAMDTVEQFLGVPIHFYAQVDFNAFIKLVDEIDGVKINLTERMLGDWNGNGNRFWLEPGLYTLDGKAALVYARERKTAGDDVARGGRQMEIVMAIRDRILDFKMMPTLISRAPTIYKEIAGGVQTNMSLDQAIQLAMLMTQIPRENLRTYNIDYTMVTQEWTTDGTQEILRPIPDKIRVLRDQVFSQQGTAAAPIVLGGDDLTLAKQENARIAVLNGTASGGLAESTGNYLLSLGLNVVTMSNSGESYTYTTIINHNANAYTLQYLAGLMQVPSNRIYSKLDTSGAADLTIYLGSDWANSNPMP